MCEQVDFSRLNEKNVLKNHRTVLELSGHSPMHNAPVAPLCLTVPHCVNVTEALSGVKSECYASVTGSEEVTAPNRLSDCMNG